MIFRYFSNQKTASLSFPYMEQEKITLDSFTEEEKQKRKRNQLMALNPISAPPPVSPTSSQSRYGNVLWVAPPTPHGLQELGALHRDTHCSEPEGLPSGLLASWAAPPEADCDDVKASLRETHSLGKH